MPQCHANDQCSIGYVCSTYPDKSKCPYVGASRSKRCMNCRREHDPNVRCEDVLEPCVDCGRGLKIHERWYNKKLKGCRCKNCIDKRMEK